MSQTKVLIIAEAGVNHNGDINLAKKLIDAAVDAGVDIVKFQTFKADNLVSKKAVKASYQLTTTDFGESQFEMIKKLELTNEDHKTLINYCNKKDIRFLSTAFDLESIDLLVSLGITIFKIPSGEITNLPYLEKIGELKKEVIMSTGMCTLQEIKDALNVLEKKGTLRNNITVLHCNTEYPTPMHDVNLKAMLQMKKELGIRVGYSDHTLGIEVPVAAVAMGAEVIEKHFTLDKNMQGPDHKASLEPDELKQMVIAIRNIEQALGTGVKTPTGSEIKNIAIARKSIHTAKKLKAGHIISLDDLVMKRPGDGISPMKLKEVVGKKLLRDCDEDYKLSFVDLK